ncbi:TspO/MBR family protein [Rhodospira trueperi]|uniref:Tryptophan-rich sensory protein n=1 Tax=Rhodospira trueperi TaxID=69960 RepID=A0A1G6Z3W9_9PROT|nr:TspO/MBR family protein [Rhodospira trueperi]SDD97359.1 tryptophan-rich sensory protein [Rhodospira trueperi]
MSLDSLIAFVVLSAASFGAASTGAIFRPGEWYAALRKPSWVPPNWLFAPAWTVMYVLMAVAAFLVWTFGEGPAVLSALAVYAVQLVLNALWSPVFFGRRSLGGGVVVVLALWLAVLSTTLLFLQVNDWAGLLFLPYLAWVTFASALTVTVWRLNRTGD